MKSMMFVSIVVLVAGLAMVLFYSLSGAVPALEIAILMIVSGATTLFLLEQRRRYYLEVTKIPSGPRSKKVA
jgi:uncharacterized protein YybS (DUF2232 family)